MKIGISLKLTLAILGLTTLVLLATLSLSRWSFERGFLDYVNSVEQQRLERLAGELAEIYQRGGDNWRALTPRQFQRLIDQTGPNSRPGGAHAPPPEAMYHRPPPDFRPGIPGRGHPPRPQGPPPGTALYSVSDELIMSSRGSDQMDRLEDIVSVPVMLGDRQIATLYTEPRRHLTRPSETEFSRQQWHAGLFIAAIALLLAALLSLLLSKTLLGPIRQLMQRIGQLSDDNYRPAPQRESRLKTAANQDELQLLTHNVERLATTLDQNRSARSRWIADISHELRTPLTILIGEIAAMQDGLRPLGTEQLESLSQEAARLQRLIEDLYQVSLSDIGGLSYQFSAVPLQPLLESLLNRARAHAAGLSVNANLDLDDLEVNADAPRIEQLFSNILENALAYTDVPGRIEVSAKQVDGYVEICFEDTPPGVTASECEALFEPLYRPDPSRSRRRAGAGLGLAICRNIVRAHDGQINATPSALGGLQLLISLPIKRR